MNDSNESTVLVRVTDDLLASVCFGIKDRRCEQLVFTLTGDRIGHVDEIHECLLTGDELDYR